MAVRFRRRAKDDVLEAALWYEDRRPGLGGEFLEAIDEVLSRIAENPRQFPVYEEPARRALLLRFPYAIYYQAQPVVILRVLHLRRHPDTWKRGPAG
jgi:plasmid stabilization system protein ParE